MGERASVKKLKRAFEDLQQLREDGRNASSPEFRRWKDRTRGNLENLFGPNHEHTRNFGNLAFCLARVSVGGEPSWTPQDETKMQEDLEYAHLLLKDAVADLMATDAEADDAGSADTLEDVAEAVDKRSVMVVHGRNIAARDDMFQFLRAIGLQPLEWEEGVSHTGKAAPYTGEIVDAMFARAQAVVVLLTGDDVARRQEEYLTESDPAYEKDLTPQARPNVLFEAGIAFGSHADRTVLVELGKLRPFSDVVGRNVIRVSRGPEWRHRLAQRLGDAGCEVNRPGEDWLTTGRFEDPIPLVDSSDHETEPSGFTPDELDVRILAALADAPGGADTVPGLVSVLEVHRVEIELHLEDMQRHGCVALEDVPMVGRMWSLATAGRRIVVDRGLV